MKRILDLTGNLHSPASERWRDGIVVSQSALSMPNKVPMLTGRAVRRTVDALTRIREQYRTWSKPIILDGEHFWPWSTARGFQRGESWFKAVDSAAKILFPFADIYWYSGQEPDRWPGWANLAVPVYASRNAQFFNTGPMFRAVRWRKSVSTVPSILPLIMPRFIESGSPFFEPDKFVQPIDLIGAAGFARVGVFYDEQTQRVDALIRHASRHAADGRGETAR